MYVFMNTESTVCACTSEWLSLPAEEEQGDLAVCVDILLWELDVGGVRDRIL